MLEDLPGNPMKDLSIRKEIDKLLWAFSGTHTGNFGMDSDIVDMFTDKLEALLTLHIREARIDELEQLEFIDWESYHHEKKNYDDSTNYLIDEYVGKYTKDRILELQREDK
jgi:hypothetical protein